MDSSAQSSKRRLVYLLPFGIATFLAAFVTLIILGQDPTESDQSNQESKSLISTQEEDSIVLAPSTLETATLSNSNDPELTSTSEAEKTTTTRRSIFSNSSIRTTTTTNPSTTKRPTTTAAKTTASTLKNSTTRTTRATTTTTTKVIRTTTTACDPSVKWSLVFQDDFTSAKSLDNWNVYDSEGHLGYGLRSPVAVTVKSGFLVITARTLGTQVISGGLDTKTRLPHGKFEARVRIDDTPDKVLRGKVLAVSSAGSAQTIYESSNFIRTFYSRIGSTTPINHGKNPTGWFTLTLEWQDNKVAVYRDGTLVSSKTITPSNSQKKLTIQLDPHNDDTLSQPTSMRVDWVKISKPKTCS